MQTREHFIERIMTGSPVLGPQKAAAPLPVFAKIGVPSPATLGPPQRPFAQSLLEESGFGSGETLPRNEVVLGDQKTNRFLPPGMTYWRKSSDRPFHILLFDLQLTGRSILEDVFFRQTDQLEDALHRIVQDALEGFERGGAGRTADRKQGAQTETLCVVSVIDNRRDGPGRQIVCFGTKCTATDALEVFTLREEARDWDRPLAEEHLGQLFERHFKRLGTGAGWQDAFVSGEERKKAKRLMDECAARQPDEKVLQNSIRDLLDEIAGSFGLRRRSANDNRRLVMHALPDSHSIAVDPAEARKRSFKNPFHGLRIFDADERLIGYIVYVLDRKTQAERLRSQLAEHNHFHNVLVVYPDQTGASLELWQGTAPLRGRLIGGLHRSRFDGEGGVVQLLSHFFVVSRSAIVTPQHLATELAWRAQHLKALASDELGKEQSKPKDHRPLRDLLDVFNQALATMDEAQFSDAYAQTITYGLLAARWLSSEREDLRFTRKNIDALLPSTSPFLHDLFERLVNSKFDQNLSWLLDDITSLLSRTMVADVFQGEKDPSIHFYQDFLDAYDPQIRKDQGVYYTPDEVVSYIVRTAHSSLQEEFGLPLGLADTTSWAEFAKARQLEVPEGVNAKEPFVQVLDPATGTGTFLLRVIEVIHETLWTEYKRHGLDEKASQKAWVVYVRQHLLPRINGFELMVAPYVVSHLRLGLALQDTGFVFRKEDRLRVFLTNTLEMHVAPQLSLLGSHVAEEAREAEQVKKETPISVVVGNPPYDRHDASDAAAGGWVRRGDPGWNEGHPLLTAYTEPVTAAGGGVDLKNLYNHYVYFWRWAGWKVFERTPRPGLVSLITPGSFLRGKAFRGMRIQLRASSSALFLLDLEGDQRGTRKTENVFMIKTPVVVCTAVRMPKGAHAEGGYRRVTGTREEKLLVCGQLRSFRDGAWEPLFPGVDAPLLGVAAGGVADYVELPSVSDIFPWNHTGAEFQRTWPIGETTALLVARWQAFLRAANRADAFSENRDRKIDKAYLPLFPEEKPQKALAKEARTAPPPRIARLGFRSFQRAWCFADSRIGTVLKPILWHVLGDKQVFMTSLLTGVLGKGPAATATCFVPDKHHFRGSYGGKDVIPLWRDANGREANIASGFLVTLSATYRMPVVPEDVFAYAYAVLSNPGYVARFEEELQVPGPRLPVTKDRALFDRGAKLGRELLQWHTYGERYRTRGDGFKLRGAARLLKAIPEAQESYPEKHKYDQARMVLRVGEGEVGPVSADVWTFAVSGLQVVKSWLDYRMKDGAGRRSSPLDDIRPECWTDEMTGELLELLWVLEWTLGRYPVLDAWLDEVLTSELFTADEIPAPTDEERKEPKVERAAQRSLLEDEDE